MKISLRLEKSETSDVTIMVDTLRASTTICVALDSFNKVIPVTDYEKAKFIASKENAILAGERNGVKIKGFDVGNSPVNIQNFRGDTLVLTTTNGTRILNSMNSKYILIGSFINAKAVARKAMKLASTDIEVVMAGVKGRFAIDDFLGAGAILSYMPYDNLSEFANTSVIAVQDKEVLNKSVLDSYSSKKLHSLGSGADVEFCLKHNSYNNVPIYKDAYLKKI